MQSVGSLQGLWHEAQPAGLDLVRGQQTSDLLPVKIICAVGISERGHLGLVNRLTDAPIILVTIDRKSGGDVRVTYVNSSCQISTIPV